MLKRVRPQKVINEQERYVVQVADRYHVEYIDDNKRASVEVDFGMSIGIYVNTLKIIGDDNKEVELTSQNKEKIILRIVQALEFMGCSIEYCN